jgi:GTP cyclohydrolase II
VIGAHGGAYSIYRALAVSSGTLDPNARPDLKDTGPVVEMGPHRQWVGQQTIVSLDPWGHRVAEDFRAEIEDGLDIRPTIAITRARLMLPEVREAIELGRLSEDGVVVHAGGEVGVTKAAIDPVWYLPGVAERFGVTETLLRRTLFEQTAGMYPELVTRKDLHVFLPPIGGTTLYIFGDPAAICDPARPLTCRIHDECNGSDVFGSDICTCRPYLTHGVEECIRTAQAGGAGLIVYNRKEGRALGEVTKFLVYNARKRQPGGDQAATYFARTECVAGVQDARFQQLMPDVIHWLGIKRIDRLVSMSNLKYDALIAAGIEIGERVPLPAGLVPQDAMVEIEAKKAAGYFVAESEMPALGESAPRVVGRDIKDY